MCYHSDEYDDTCRDARELQYKIDSAKEHFEDVLDMVFSNKTLDKENLHRSLEEIASYLDIEMPEGFLKIQRSNHEIRLISHYLLNLQDTKQRELV